MDAIKTLERLAQQAKARQDAQPCRLPVWSNDKRAIPREVVRSALFPASRKGVRELVEGAEIFSVAGFAVRFTGRRFDQTDLSVYLELIESMKGQPANQEVTFTAHDLLKALGKTTGGSDRVWLHSVIMRLVSGTVEIIAENRRYFGHLIESGDKDDKTGVYNLSLNARFVRFFRSGWSSIDIEDRKDLTSSTSQALHAWLSSHTTQPKPHNWSTLAGIVGIVGKNARATIRTGLDQLVKSGFLAEWSESKGKVSLKIRALAVDNSTG